MSKLDISYLTKPCLQLCSGLLAYSWILSPWIMSGWRISDYLNNSNWKQNSQLEKQEEVERMAVSGIQQLLKAKAALYVVANADLHLPRSHVDGKKTT